MSNLQKKTAVYKVLINNDSVKVTEYSFSPGSETGWHKHLWDYVVVPQTDGKLLLVSEKGRKTTTTLSKGNPYYRRAGIEHNVINAGEAKLVFIEIEIKAYTSIN